MNLRCTIQRRFYYGSRTSARKKRVLSYGTELCGRIRQKAHAVEVHRSNRKGKQKACRKNAFRSSCRKRSRIRGKSDRTKHRQSPCGHDVSESFLCQTLEDGVPTKYCLSPAQCSHFLRLAEIAGCPPPAEIEALLLKQGGAYQSPDPFNASVCGRPPRSGRKQRSETASDCQLTLFPLC